MNFFKKLFGSKEDTPETPMKSESTKSIETNEQFWNWFTENETKFYNVVKSIEHPQEKFFSQLEPKLNELKDGIYFATGMFDDNTAELVFTAEGLVKNIAFVEDLVKTAPSMQNWKFTALKPSMEIENMAIEMAGYTYKKENLSFYSIDHDDFPDEVDIVVVYNDYNEEDKATNINGSLIFLDNYLGEMNFATTIDNINVIPKEQAQKELIPIAKLKDFLLWREKEFIEQYSGHSYNTENDNYSILEAELNNGRPLIATINSTVLDWDAKASHPWILTVKLSYDGNHNNGMPDGETVESLTQLEDDLETKLKNFEGHLNIGRQTADNEREIYFACKDFREASKAMHTLKNKYAKKLEVDYEIFRDKYWQSLEMFRSN